MLGNLALYYKGSGRKVERVPHASTITTSPNLPLMIGLTVVKARLPALSQTGADVQVSIQPGSARIKRSSDIRHWRSVRTVICQF
jgi:hypothetical protein